LNVDEKETEQLDTAKTFNQFGEGAKRDAPTTRIEEEEIAIPAMTSTRGVASTANWPGVRSGKPIDRKIARSCTLHARPVSQQTLQPTAHVLAGT
jgi:hypothetical protein